MPQDLLEPILREWRQLLSQWCRSGELSRAVREALRLPGEPERLWRLLERWSAGDFADLPPVVTLPASALPSAAGAYAISTGTIYLNQAWLLSAGRDQVLAVLTEELGHHLDGLLNGGDTPGDEGELLAALLHGDGPISEERRQALLAEDDAGSLRLGEQVLPVERAARVVSTPIQATTSLNTRHEWRNSFAFAALRSDGSVVTWGDARYGGDSGDVDFNGPDPTLTVSQIFSNHNEKNISRIFSTATEFAALRADGSVVPWGSNVGIDFDGPANTLTVQQIFTSAYAFAALRSDGSVITWGVPEFGGDSSGIDFDGPSDNLRVSQISSTANAFAALRGDGSVVTWGAGDFGGNSSGVDFDGPANNLTVRQIFSTALAFAALRGDGSVVTWGFGQAGGDSGGVDFDGPANTLRVIQIQSTQAAFAALRSDGSVVTWGDAGYGGDSGGVDFDGPDNTLKVVAFADPFMDDRLVFGDPLPVITLAVAPATGVREDSTSHLRFTFTRTGPVTSPLTVNYRVGGTAEPGTDYAGLADSSTIKTVSFAAGSAIATVTLVPIADTTAEANETIALTLASSAGYTIGTTQAIIATIRNDDLPLITLAVSPETVSEDGEANLVYTFSRTGDASSSLRVNFTVAGSATLGTDYSGIALSGTIKTVVFAKDARNATVTVNPRGDATIEPDERVSLTLAAGGGYSIGTPQAVTGTIRNDDVPRVTLALSPIAVAEDGPNPLLYTFSRSGPADSALSVNYTVGGSATLGTDYSGIALSGTTKTIAFADGSSTATLILDPTADTTFELNETVALTLVNGTGYTIGTTAAVTGTIRNDDLPVISLAVSPEAVSEDGDANLVYTFLRTGDTSSALRVDYTVNGSATLGTDFTGIPSSGSTKTVVFARGSSTATVTVNPRADITCEADESVALSLEAGPGYSVGTTTPVTGWIRNDDLPRVSLAVSPKAFRENDSGVLTYTFTRTGPTSEALNVQVAIGGTATAGVDYTGITAAGTTTTVAFAAGASIATVTVDPTADTSIEPDETVALTLAAGSGYTIGTTAAVVGTIKNDDSSLTLYDATATTRPGQQGWLAVNRGLLGRETGSANGTSLDTTLLPPDLAGYSNRAATSEAPLVNAAFPSLDRTVGFRLDFRLNVLKDVNESPNRAGFSVTLLDHSPTPLGIELGFQRDPASSPPGQQGILFSQEGGANPFQKIGERAGSIPFTSAVAYSLRILDQSYVLLAGNAVVLTGALRDYSQAPPDPRLPFNPYRLPNFLFLGDNTSRSSAQVELGSITLGVALTGSGGNDRYTGTTASDSYNGLAGADVLNGGGGNDWLAGGAGADTLNGGLGDDLLIGGSGADEFLFHSGTPFSGSQLGVDTIVDFNPAEDSLRLGRATFTSLPAGSSLETSVFAVVSGEDAAASSGALVVYDSASGGLFYNPNGSAAGFADPAGGSAAGGGLFARLLATATGMPVPTLTRDAFAVG